MATTARRLHHLCVCRKLQASTNVWMMMRKERRVGSLWWYLLNPFLISSLESETKTEIPLHQSADVRAVWFFFFFYLKIFPSSPVSMTLMFLHFLALPVCGRQRSGVCNTSLVFLAFDPIWSNRPAMKLSITRILLQRSPVLISTLIESILVVPTPAQPSLCHFLLQRHGGETRGWDTKAQCWRSPTRCSK